MKVFAFIVAPALIFPTTVLSLRRGNPSTDTDVVEGDDGGVDASPTSCCCKAGKKCEKDASSGSDGKRPVYHANKQMCCKRKAYSYYEGCPWFSGYRIQAEEESMCVAPAEVRFEAPKDGEDSEEEVKQQDATDLVSNAAPKGSVAHTVDNYCRLDHDIDSEDENMHEAVKRDDAGKKRRIVKALVKEMQENNLDSMAKELFSVYVCMRWAPSADFVDIANAEIATGQMDDKSDAYQHFLKNRFMPMRCSRNIKVYGETSSHSTHFENFESDIEALSKWFHVEQGGVMEGRLSTIHKLSAESLEEESKLFDINLVSKQAKACEEETSVNGIDFHRNSSAAILANCKAALWWKRRLQDWHAALPFTSFMAPDAKASSEASYKPNEHVLVCFGKRVASQLHRRENGQHLMADQSAVGCHGFWDFEESQKMLHRIVSLWKPPTCQLAALEIEIKIHIMELIANINTRLFDALPEMLGDETNPQEEGSSLTRADSLGVATGVLSSISGLFSQFQSKYQRIGALLGNTVVKWVVCPLKPIENEEEGAALDKVLGNEDSLSRFYEQQAYAKWTGKSDLLPGEECVKPDNSPLPRCEMCSIGILQENRPEPYFNKATGKFDEFVCPIRPLLPAKQQLRDVFMKKLDTCMVAMNVKEVKDKKWFYRGYRPHDLQYDKADNLPQKEYTTIKVVGMTSRPDAELGIWRDWVSYARRCTEEEVQLTPRWCEPPVVENEHTLMNSALKGVAEGVAEAAAGVASGGGKLLEAVGWKTKTSSNSEASWKRFGEWWHVKTKNMEKGMRDLFTGHAAARKTRLRERLFGELEAGELLHRSSFQKELLSTGADSKKYQTYDRYVVTCPCANFDPEKEFNLKYMWSEHALVLISKVKRATGDMHFNKPALWLKLRGEGVLHMDNAHKAWVTYSSSWLLPGDVWRRTDNPWFQELAGIQNSMSDGSISVDTLAGFEAFFACGTRLQMHNAQHKFGETGNSASLLECMKNGKESNQKLREDASHDSFIPEETVVRVTFYAADRCSHESSASTVKPEAPVEVDEKGEPKKPKNVFSESENPLYKEFHESGSKCQAISDDKLPEHLKKEKKTKSYRGMLLGHGLPVETLTEVVLDPEDVLVALGFE